MRWKAENVAVGILLTGILIVGPGIALSRYGWRWTVGWFVFTAFIAGAGVVMAALIVDHDHCPWCGDPSEPSHEPFCSNVCAVFWTDARASTKYRLPSNNPTPTLYGTYDGSEPWTKEG